MARVWRFRHRWHVPAEPTRVYAVCAAIEDYPRWWPQVRHVTRIDDATGEARVRSLLPMTLRLIMIREIEDPATGRLRVTITGDRAGWAEFVLTPTESGTEVDYRQEVVVSAPRWVRAAHLLPSVLTLNHAWMMRSCARGMRRRLG